MGHRVKSAVTKRQQVHDIKFGANFAAVTSFFVVIDAILSEVVYAQNFGNDAFLPEVSYIIEARH